MGLSQVSHTTPYSRWTVACVRKTVLDIVLKGETDPLLKSVFVAQYYFVYYLILLNISYSLLFSYFSMRDILVLFLLQVNWISTYYRTNSETSGLWRTFYMCSLFLHFTCILFYCSPLILISHGCRSNLFATEAITITNPEVNQSIMKFTA